MMIKLTEREKLILRLVSKGFNNAQIGESIQISKHTAKAHLSAIIRKMNISDRVEAAYLAGKFNLL